MMFTFPNRYLALTAALIACALAGCSPLRVLNAVTPGSSCRVTPGVSYGPETRQKLDIYTPLDLKEPAPVVLFFYGGNWNDGKRSDYRFVGTTLAARGMVSVVADYRLYPEVRYPGFLEDSARAVAWTAENVQGYGGDGRRLFVMGHSAGAYIAAMLALDPRWLAAQGLTPSALRGWIGLAGPYDFIPIQNLTTRPVFWYPDTPVESQPINHVSAASPPALLIAAKNDDLVNPVRNTGGLATRLRAVGVEVREVYFNHVNHATLIGAMAPALHFLAPVLATVEQFVKSQGEQPVQHPAPSLPSPPLEGGEFAPVAQ
jgi:acetyl esterase/lipase